MTGRPWFLPSECNKPCIEFHSDVVTYMGQSQSQVSTPGYDLFENKCKTMGIG